MPTNKPEYMKKNYKKFWWTAAAIKKRVTQNAARRIMIKKWKVSKWDGKEVDHKNWTENGNKASNLRVLSKLKNRVLWQKKAMIWRTHKYNITK